MTGMTNLIVLDPKDVAQLLHIATLIENPEALRPGVREGIAAFNNATADNPLTIKITTQTVIDG